MDERFHDAGCWRLTARIREGREGFVARILALPAEGCACDADAMFFVPPSGVDPGDRAAVVAAFDRVMALVRSSRPDDVPHLLEGFEVVPDVHVDRGRAYVRRGASLAEGDLYRVEIRFPGRDGERECRAASAVLYKPLDPRSRERYPRGRFDVIHEARVAACGALAAAIPA